MGVDYTIPFDTTYTFLPGEDKVVKSFGILLDEIEETLESFSVSCDIDPSSTALFNPKSAEISIRDRKCISFIQSSLILFWLYVL